MTRYYPPVLILRHGETEWNAAGRLQGHFDSPLTQKGVRQAEAQRAYLATRDLSDHRAYSSPQERAFRTASIALTGLVPKIETDARLAEMGVGDWAGRKLSDISQKSSLDQGGITAVYERAPGGEGFAALHARCRDFLADLRTPSVLVTHGMTACMLRLVLLGQDWSHSAPQPDAQGFIYGIENGRQQIISVGS